MTSITVRIVPARGDALPMIGFLVVMLTTILFRIVFAYFVPWNDLAETGLEILIFLSVAVLTLRFRGKINEHVLGGQPKSESYECNFRRDGRLWINAPSPKVARLPDGVRQLTWQIQD